MKDREPFLLSNAAQFVGRSLGTSGWVRIDQIQVNVFGEVSRWRKPGHCDPEAAKAGPYGGTILHGFHMLSLITHFCENVGLSPADGSRPLNYGLDRVRVLKPVPVGDGVRLRSTVGLLDASDKGDGEWLLKTSHEIEAEGVEGIVMFAEYLSYWFPRQQD